MIMIITGVIALAFAIATVAYVLVRGSAATTITEEEFDDA